MKLVLALAGLFGVGLYVLFAIAVALTVPVLIILALIKYVF